MPPNRPFNLVFDKDIYRQYDELDRHMLTMTENYLPVSFRQVVGYGQIVNWQFDKMVELLDGIEEKFDVELLKERFERARTWLEKYNRDEMVTLIEEQNKEYYDLLSELEKSQIRAVVEAIKSGEKSIPEWMELVYNIPKKDVSGEEELKNAQKKFFENIYQLLLKKDKGPRLGTYFWATDKNKLLKLLDF